MDNNKSGIQTSFLATVRSRIPNHTSFPDELAELLSISRDSAYRRIREETILSLHEARILCDRFNVSIDALMSHDSGNVSFEYRAQNASGLTFETWLESILDNLALIESVPGADMIWHSKNLPLFHYFQFPRLAAFKLFFWMKLSNGEDFGNNKYDERQVGSKMIGMGEKIWEKYSRLQSTEIISRELINTTLRQIEYSHDVGLIDKNQALGLCKDCTEMMSNLQGQIQRGLKRAEDRSPSGGKFEVYLNELLIGDDSILFRMGDKQTVFMTHNNFNIMSTSHQAFCQRTEQFMDSIIRTSVLISHAAEKERMKFFNWVNKQIEELKSTISA
ncbi:MAG TPA: helix-turn-helix transcriptional regulator [Cyclobacteriaceae bacterium]|nr:helix-turn-helix transcriptional regulator [Cyclobacteriaceae bacterium]